MAQNVYKYGPLDTAERQIRLVTVLPGSWTHDIECQLMTVSLNDKPHYEVSFGRGAEH